MLANGHDPKHAKTQPVSAGTGTGKTHARVLLVHDMHVFACSYTHARAYVRGVNYIDVKHGACE